MKTITFFVKGKAAPKGRPRFFRRGKFFGTYTPTATRSWEQFVQFQALQHQPKILPLCSITMEASFILPRPHTLPKRIVEHTKKPDCDNLIKCIKDALEGMFFKNDSQIVCLHVRKMYECLEYPEVGVFITLNYHDDNQKEDGNATEKRSKKGSRKKVRR